MFKRALTRCVLVFFAIVSICVVDSASAQILMRTSISTIGCRPVTGGIASVCSVTLSSAAPTAGYTLELMSGDTNVAVAPASVTIPAGATGTRFSVNTKPLLVDTTVPINVTSPVTMSFQTTVLAPKVASLTFNRPVLPGGTETVATVALTGPAASGFVLPLACDDPFNVPLTSSSLGFAAGQSSTTFTIKPKPVESQKTAMVTVGGAAGKSTALTITPPSIISLTTDQSKVIGFSGVYAKLTLDAPAPNNYLVPLASSNPDVVSVNSPQAMVYAGSTTTTIGATSHWVTTESTATITAGTAPNAKSVTVTVGLPYVVSLEASPAIVKGGSDGTVTVTVKLVGNAPPDGMPVTVTSSHPDILSIPPLTVPNGTFFKTAWLKTNAVASDTVVTLTNGDGTNGKTAKVTVVPPALDRFVGTGSLGTWDVLRSRTLLTTGTDIKVVGGAEQIAIEGHLDVPVGGTVALKSSDPTVIVPPTLVIPPNSNALATASTLSVMSDVPVTITGTSGSVTKTVNVVVKPIGVAGLFLQYVGAPLASMISSIPGGHAFNIMIYLNAPAAAAGFNVPLSSSHPAIAPVPASKAIGYNSNYTFQKVQTSEVSEDTVVTITAGEGATAQSASITILARGVSAFSLSAQSITGGATVTGVVQLNDVAGSAGFVVPLASSIPQVTLPASVTVPAGMATVSFPITTVAVTADTPGILTAGTGATAKTVNVLLRP